MMKAMKTFVSLAIFLCATGIAISDDTTVTGSATVSTESTTIQGEVVRVDAGKSIVIRNDEGAEVTYRLGADVAVPAEVEVGKTVTLYTDAPASKTVTRVTTTSVGPFTKRVEETTTSGTGGSLSGSTTVYTVRSYQPGSSLTLEDPSGKTVVFSLDAQSEIPAGITVGKTITVETDEMGGKKIVRRAIVTPGGATIERETTIEDSGE